MFVEYLSDYQGLWSDFAYAQSGLGLCLLNITHCWKSHFWTCAVEQVRQSLLLYYAKRIYISMCLCFIFARCLPIKIIYKYNSGKLFITRHYKSSKVQVLFRNVIFEDQVLYAKPKNEVLFARIKLLYAELSPFQCAVCLKYLIAHYYSNQKNQ